jgi:hypothetical protein
MLISSPDYKPSCAVWDAYSKKILATRVQKDEDFKYCNLKIDSIPQSLTDKLLNSLSSVSRREYSKHDCTDDYVSGNVSAREEAGLRNTLLYFNLEEEQLNIIKEICEAIKPTVEACLGTGFKLINTKCVETFVNAGDMGPTKLHFDGLPGQIHKALV